MFNFPYKDAVRFLLCALVLTIILMMVKSSLGVVEIIIVSTMIVVIVVIIDVVCKSGSVKNNFTQFKVPDCERPDMSEVLRMCRVKPEEGAVRGNAPAAPVESFALERSAYSAPYATNMPFISYSQEEANKQYANYDPSLYTNDFQYVTQPPEYYEPLGKPDATMRFDFEHGFTYLNTDKWTVPQRHPPVCISNAKPNVCPITLGGQQYVSVREFHDAQRIMPYDNINVRYIQDKLNGGRTGQ